MTIDKGHRQSWGIRDEVDALNATESKGSPCTPAERRGSAQRVRRTRDASVNDGRPAGGAQCHTASCRGRRADGCSSSQRQAGRASGTRGSVEGAGIVRLLATRALGFRREEHKEVVFQVAEVVAQGVLRHAETERREVPVQRADVHQRRRVPAGEPQAIASSAPMVIETPAAART
jgi:hypothetical protein